MIAAPRVPERTDPASLLLSARALAGRRHSDVIRLLPQWPALISCLRRARRARWIVGDAGVAVDWTETPRMLRIAEPPGGDAVHVRFRFGAWRFAFARANGSERSFHALAADGSPIATLALDEVQPAVDEVIWRLCDDTAGAHVAHARIAPYRNDDLLPTNAVPRAHAGLLADDALNSALGAAVRAGIPLRVTVTNRGAIVTSPRHATAPLIEGGVLRLRARGGIGVRVRVGQVRYALDRDAATDAPAAIVIYGTDRCAARVEPADERDRAAWQRILAQAG